MRLFVVALVACLLTQCYEPQKGCLDVEATNFDAAADESCCQKRDQVCCCTYPQLRFLLRHRFGGTDDDKVWLPDQLVSNDRGQSFRFNVAYYLSDPAVYQQGVEVRPTDVVRLPIFPTNITDTVQTFANDIMLVRRTPLEYSAGTFRPSGAFERIRVRVGLVEATQRVNPRKITVTHPLQLQPERLWRNANEGFAALQVTIAYPPDQTPDTLRFFKSDLPNFFIEQRGSFGHRAGYNFDLYLTADYAHLFKGIDLSNKDLPTWRRQLLANLPNVFSIHQ